MPAIMLGLSISVSCHICPLTKPKPIDHGSPGVEHAISLLASNKLWFVQLDLET